MQERLGEVTLWSSRPGPQWAFTQQFINVCVLPGSSESVTRLWGPSQDKCMSLHTCDVLCTRMGFTDSLGLIHGPQGKNPSILRPCLSVQRRISLSTASGRREEGRANRLPQACGSKAEARSGRSGSCWDSAMCVDQSELLGLGPPDRPLRREPRSLQQDHTLRAIRWRGH